MVKIITFEFPADFILALYIVNRVVRSSIKRNKIILKIVVEAVQQLVGSKAIYSANLLIVISPTGFTERATKLAKANSVLCIDHDQIYTIGTTNNDQQYKTKTVEYKDREKRNGMLTIGMLVWEEYQERD